jgi:hypothetical protein
MFDEFIAKGGRECAQSWVWTLANRVVERRNMIMSIWEGELALRWLGELVSGGVLWVFLIILSFFSSSLPFQIGLPLFVSFVSFVVFPSSTWPSWIFFLAFGLLAVFYVPWIQNSNFMLFDVNVLIKGEIEKPSGQYLGLIMMSHWLTMVWIWNRDILVVLPYYSCGESHLLVS